MSILVDDIVAFPHQAEPDADPASFSEAGLTILGADFGESKVSGSMVKTSTGVVMVDRDPDPRTIALRLAVREDAEFTLPEVVARLEAIVGEMQSRDTWIRRDFHVGGDFGSVLYHVTGEVSFGDFAGWQTGASPDVTLTMVCDYACYATEEVESGPFTTAAGKRQTIYTLPASKSTAKGLKRIIIENTGGVDWRGLLWSEECRYYQPETPTAEPAYEAVALTPKGGSVVSAGPVPPIRAVGAIASGTGAISPPLPTGVVKGDLLVMFAESGGATASAEANTALTAAGWTAPPSPYAAQKTGNTRLTVLYRIATGSDPTLTNDTGDHQMARIIAIKAGTFDPTAPFNTAGVGTQGATKSVSVPGATTTRDNCLIFAAASGSLPDGSSTTEFGSATNASLSELTERIDNTVTDGDGGALWVVSGAKATKGTYSATTCTAVTEAPRGVVSLAINPLPCITHASLTAGELMVLSSEISGVGHMTHLGPRRMWMRVEQPSGEVGDVKLRLLWRALGSSRWVDYNPIVSPYVVGDECLLDMGECRPQEAVVGDQRWEWVLMAWAPGGSGSIRVRDVYPLSTEQYVKCSEPYKAPAADTQSTKSPGTAANVTGIGSTAWNEPSGAKAVDGTYASIEEKSSQTVSNFLQVTNFSFALPETAAITGVVVGVRRVAAYGPGATANTWVYDVAAQLILPGASAYEMAVSERSKDYAGEKWSTTERTEYYGGSADRWGYNDKLTVAAVSNSEFGFRFAIALQSGSGNPTCKASVNHIGIGIYYTVAEDPNRLCFSGRSIELATEGVFRKARDNDAWGPVVPGGFMPVDIPGRPSRGILVPSAGDLAVLPDSGLTSLSAMARARAGHLYAAPGS